MNKPAFTSLITALLLFAGCSDAPEKQASKAETASATPSQNAPEPSGNIYGVDDAALAQQDNPHAGMTQQQAAGFHTGTVLESMDTAGYTYVKVDDNGETYWIAGPQTSLTAGEKISYVEQMWMHDFESKTLQKKFDKVMFVATIVPAGKTPAEGNSSQAEEKAAPAPATSPAATASVPKAAGEYTVEDIYTKKDELNGKTIQVKGEVVKISSGIMGKNWVHLRDGTGQEGSNDLVVTTLSPDVSVGETVTATGLVKTNLDFGYGYKYAVLLEDATFTK